MSPQKDKEKHIERHRKDDDDGWEYDQDKERDEREREKEQREREREREREQRERERDRVEAQREILREKKQQQVYKLCPWNTCHRIHKEKPVSFTWCLLIYFSSVFVDGSSSGQQ